MEHKNKKILFKKIRRVSIAKQEPTRHQQAPLQILPNPGQLQSTGSVPQVQPHNSGMTSSNSNLRRQRSFASQKGSDSPMKSSGENDEHGPQARSNQSSLRSGQIANQINSKLRILQTVLSQPVKASPGGRRSSTNANPPPPIQRKATERTAKKNLGVLQSVLAKHSQPPALPSKSEFIPQQAEAEPNAVRRSEDHHEFVRPKPKMKMMKFSTIPHAPHQHEPGQEPQKMQILKQISLKSETSRKSLSKNQKKRANLEQFQSPFFPLSETGFEEQESPQLEPVSPVLLNPPRLKGASTKRNEDQKPGIRQENVDQRLFKQKIYRQTQGLTFQQEPPVPVPLPLSQDQREDPEALPYAQPGVPPEASTRADETPRVRFTNYLKRPLEKNSTRTQSLREKRALLVKKTDWKALKILQSNPKINLQLDYERKSRQINFISEKDRYIRYHSTLVSQPMKSQQTEQSSKKQTPQFQNSKVAFPKTELVSMPPSRPDVPRPSKGISRGKMACLRKPEVKTKLHEGKPRAQKELSSPVKLGQRLSIRSDKRRVLLKGDAKQKEGSLGGVKQSAVRRRGKLDGQQTCQLTPKSLQTARANCQSEKVDFGRLPINKMIKKSRRVANDNQVLSSRLPLSRKPSASVVQPSKSLQRVINIGASSHVSYQIQAQTHQEELPEKQKSVDPIEAPSKSKVQSSDPSEELKNQSGKLKAILLARYFQANPSQLITFLAQSFPEQELTKGMIYLQEVERIKSEADTLTKKKKDKATNHTRSKSTPEGIVSKNSQGSFTQPKSPLQLNFDPKQGSEILSQSLSSSDQQNQAPQKVISPLRFSILEGFEPAPVVITSIEKRKLTKKLSQITLQLDEANIDSGIYPQRISKNELDQEKMPSLSHSFIQGEGSSHPMAQSGCTSKMIKGAIQISGPNKSSVEENQSSLKMMSPLQSESPPSESLSKNNSSFQEPLRPDSPEFTPGRGQEVPIQPSQSRPNLKQQISFSNLSSIQINRGDESRVDFTQLFQKNSELDRAIILDRNGKVSVKSPVFNQRWNKKFYDKHNRQISMDNIRNSIQFQQFRCNRFLSFQKSKKGRLLLSEQKSEIMKMQNILSPYERDESAISGASMGAKSYRNFLTGLDQSNGHEMTPGSARHQPRKDLQNVKRHSVPERKQLHVLPRSEAISPSHSSQSSSSKNQKAVDFHIVKTKHVEGDQPMKPEKYTKKIQRKKILWKKILPQKTFKSPANEPSATGSLEQAFEFNQILEESNNLSLDMKQNDSTINLATHKSLSFELNDNKKERRGSQYNPFLDCNLLDGNKATYLRKKSGHISEDGMVSEELKLQPSEDSFQISRRALPPRKVSNQIIRTEEFAELQSFDQSLEEQGAASEEAVAAARS